MTESNIELGCEKREEIIQHKCPLYEISELVNQRFTALRFHL